MEFFYSFSPPSIPASERLTGSNKDFLCCYNKKIVILKDFIVKDHFVPSNEKCFGYVAILKERFASLLFEQVYLGC